MQSGSKLEIRGATTEDAADIQRLACELAETVGDAPPVEGAVRKRLEELLETPRARVLVVENGWRVVGAVSFWIKPDLAHGDDEEHRRTGVGKLLMEQVRSAASDNDASLIELVATTANVAAREFYRSLGFVEADVVALEFVGSHENPPQPEE